VIETFTKQTFDPLLNTSFRVRAEGPGAPGVDLVLVETSERPQKGLINFSLVFRGPHGLQRQGTFSLEHPALGAFDLFMTAINADADGMYWQAVFNRMAAVPETKT
jgi:hypothetical protein